MAIIILIFQIIIVITILLIILLFLFIIIIIIIIIITIIIIKIIIINILYYYIIIIIIIIIIKGFASRDWPQFADDAASTTSLELECQNQLLLNLFSRWCSWADMSIRSDKCHSFGLKKLKTASAQFKPKVYINNKLVEPLDAGESYTCDVILIKK